MPISTTAAPVRPGVPIFTANAVYRSIAAAPSAGATSMRPAAESDAPSIRRIDELRVMVFLPVDCRASTCTPPRGTARTSSVRRAQPPDRRKVQAACRASRDEDGPIEVTRSDEVSFRGRWPPVEHERNRRRGDFFGEGIDEEALPVTRDRVLLLLRTGHDTANVVDGEKSSRH